MRSEIATSLERRVIVDLANIFADFFIDKVQKLSEKIVKEVSREPELKQLAIEPITRKEIALARKSMKNKKSCGVDDIPQCIV